MLIKNNNVETNEELNQTSQQRNKWQKWDLLVFNYFKSQPRNSKPGKQHATVKR